jgi:hypothetical protein
MIVTTPDGSAFCEIRGKWFSFPVQKYSVVDPAGNPIGEIKQDNTIANNAKYTIIFGGRKVGETDIGRVSGLVLIRYIVIENMPKLKMETPLGWKHKDLLSLSDDIGVFAQIEVKGRTWVITIMRECSDLYLLAGIATFYPDYMDRSD